MNKPNISVRQGFAQRHRRSVLAAAVLIILSVVLACLVMTCGNTYYSLAEVWKILTSEGTKGAAFTIKTLRLPKMLIGILAGIAFGVSGNTFQTLLRNPLASPDIIGVTSGASAAAVFCILMLKWSGGIVSLVAVLAGLFVAALIYLLARDRHGCSGSRMILIGIGMQAAPCTAPCLNVLLDLEKVAIGGGISKQPILVETLNEVYEEYILRGHPFSEAQARSLPRPEIVPCRFLSEANQIGAFASYQKAFLEN